MKHYPNERYQGPEFRDGGAIPGDVGSGDKTPLVLDLSSLAGYVFKHRRNCAVAALLCLAAGVILLLVMPVTYDSRATLIVDQAPGFGEPVSQSSSDEREDRVNTHVRLFTSRMVFEDVRSRSRSAGNAGPADMTEFKNFLRGLTVSRTRSSPLIELAYRAADPVRAQSILSDIIEAERGLYLRVISTSDLSVAAAADLEQANIARLETSLTELKVSQGLSSYRDPLPGLMARRDALAGQGGNRDNGIAPARDEQDGKLNDIDTQIRNQSRIELERKKIEVELASAIARLNRLVDRKRQMDLQRSTSSAAAIVVVDPPSGKELAYVRPDPLYILMGTLISLIASVLVVGVVSEAVSRKT